MRSSWASRCRQSAPQRRCARPVRCQVPSDGDLGSSFSAELERRSLREAQQLEMQEAESFDGAALLEVIRQR